MTKTWLCTVLTLDAVVHLNRIVCVVQDCAGLLAPDCVQVIEVVTMW